MAKKERISAKKSDTATKKNDSSTDIAGKTKKIGKERCKGKGKYTVSCGDDGDLGAELAALGLRIKEITGDGNCFFRALSDQLQGDERQHVQIRQRVVSYMVEHQEDFTPFVEDDESFDSYIARMKKDGVWAGYMEVVAASRCLQANLTIYQAGQPRWRVVNHPEDSAPMLHLSYHDGQHYNSVRCADDFGTGPPTLIVIRGEGTMAAKPPQRQKAGDGNWDEKDERRVASSTACTDMALVRRALEEARGDAEAAIERVIEALAAEPPEAAEAEGTAPTPPPPSTMEIAGSTEGLSEQVNSSQPMGSNDIPASGTTSQGLATAAAVHHENAGGAATTAASPTSPSGGAGKGIRLTGPRVTVGKVGARKAVSTAGAPSNNKPCPCGSHKKYKACCGPAAAAAERRRAAAAGNATAEADSETDAAPVLVAQVAALVI
ncbi:hypothetical protein VaNZ11_006243 [Volvox africanus]|uniref:OTU domain-containing protein n=1 Tax=Volvox africanus TaxID=51714 RepID=A0ABQ5S104_9CHLO|nr:hypothetical protein VaNZ11_006243 [Volvox africanus]